MLLEDHKPAFVYEFRARFNLGLRDLGVSVPWDEVVYLVAVLLRDPTSWLQTSVNQWDHPISYDWAVQVATYDMLAQVNSKRKPKPYPRPWKSNSTTRKGTVRKDARDILAKARQGELNWQNKPMPT
jgi:hypothetical protein